MYQPKSTESLNTAIASDSKLLLWIATEKTTPFSPMLLEKMARVKMMNVQITKIIDKIRNCAQLNPIFRGERLVASALNLVSDRQQYATALKEASLACFDNVKPLGDSTNEISGAMQAVAGYEDVTLCQVMVFAVKPLKDYVTVFYPKVTTEFVDLEKRREKYDAARHKKSPQMPVTQQQLNEQARVDRSKK